MIRKSTMKAGNQINRTKLHLVKGSRTAAAVRGGIGDSSSWMDIDIFLCKIQFRTHMYNHILRSKGHKKSQKAGRKEGGNAEGQPDRKIFGFFLTPSIIDRMFSFDTV